MLQSCHQELNGRNMAKVQGLKWKDWKTVIAGDGVSSRASDAILNGCLPVIIMDNVEPAFESILDWSAFSLRVREVSLILFVGLNRMKLLVQV